MTEQDRLERLAVAKAAEAYCDGAMTRRRFLRICAQAGLSLSVPGLFGCDSRPAPKRQGEDVTGPESALVKGTAQHNFLTEVRHQFKGTRIKVTMESTPPSIAVKKLVHKEFTPLTGIEVDFELLKLERVLAKISQDTALQLGSNDVFYLDQAWLARFAQDTVSPAELMENSNLAYPGYAIEDILPPLIENMATNGGELVAIPYDIPIFITMYRRDIFEELGLSVPRDMPSYLKTIQQINEAKAPHIFGTTGQWKSGHYSLECNMTSWLWGHGGSIFAADGSPTINDDQAVQAMEYMMELGKYMPPGATGWSWDGESKSFIDGKVGLYTSWGEYFPQFDDPEKSQIVGLAEAAPCPAPVALRSKEGCGFGETPGVSHQGGSSLAVSRYSKVPEAAWVFLQWATSPDITTRASLLGGGASPIRYSNYKDSRILERARVMPGSTRHFSVVFDAIMNHMGTEPHLPGWAQLAVDSFSIELGKMVTGQQSIKATLDKMAKDAAVVAKQS